MPQRVRMNRDDPRRGMGPFGQTKGDAELVTPNGLVWNQGHMGRIYSEPSTNPWGEGEMRNQGDRANTTALGGYSFVNYPAPPGTIKPGNRSGE
jgi:hypothetical protein